MSPAIARWCVGATAGALVALTVPCALPWPLALGLTARVAASLILLAVTARRPAGPVVALLWGCVCGADAVETTSRGALLLPAPGTVVESTLIGRVVRAPTADGESGWHLRLTARAPRSRRGLPMDLALPRAAPAEVAAAGCSPGAELRAWGRRWRPPDPGPGELRTWATVKSWRLVQCREVRNPRSGDDVSGSAERIAAWPGDAGERGLLRALLVGDRGALSPATVDRLRSAGLMHLVAISGMHAAWWLAPWIVLTVPLGGRPRVRACILGLALGGFLALVVVGPAVERSAWMVAAALVSRLGLGRRTPTAHTLALAAVATAAADPWRLLRPGWQLSVAATAGLLHARRGAASLFAAWLPSGAIAAHHFAERSPAGPWAHALAAPAAAVALTAGWAALLPTRFEERLAVVSVAAAGTVLDAADLAVGLAGRAQAHWVPAASVFVATALALAPSTRVSRAGWALLLLSIQVGPPPAGPGPRATLIDVGQGQSLQVVHGDASVTVIDAGGSAGRFDPGDRRVRPALARAGIRRIDRLVLSHGDLDHVGGAAVLLRRFEVGTLWVGPDVSRRPRLRRLAAQAASQGVAVGIVVRDRRVGPDGVVELWVPPSAADCPRDNDRSLLARVDTPRSLLVPGDAERCGERWHLERRRARLPSHVLVLGHHGSDTSTGSAWLDAVRPLEAWVSAGRGNRYGHPDATVRRRLQARGIPLRRTDRDGDVRRDLGSTQGRRNEAQREQHQHQKGDRDAAASER